MSDNHCYLCRVQPPTFVCFCKEVRVCQACISAHLLDNPSVGHKPVPLNFEDLTQSFRSESKPTGDQPVTKEDGKQALRAKEKALLLREIDRLTAFQTGTLLNLQNVRLTLERQVASAMEEIACAITTQSANILSRLKQRLCDLEDIGSPSAEDQNSVLIPEEILQLALEARDIDLSAIIHNSLKVVLEMKDLVAAVQPQRLYKLFGGSNNVGVFDARTERHVKTLNASIKFYHNSCSCESPNNAIYITGGSQTGRSQNEVFLFTPETGEARQLQSMQIARRSHASVFARNQLYVFGGLLDEDRMSLCERYTPEVDKWESIAQMTERRAYLSCSEHKGKIYVGGGAQRSSCEVYDPDRDSFRLIVVEHIAIEDNCCMLSLLDSVLLFHGNFRGEVTRLDPTCDKFTREKDMCVGNSWSSCPPVVVDKTVYVLRSDSVFKYDTQTGDSAYVLRMAKIVKKRMTLDG